MANASREWLFFTINTCKIRYWHVRIVTQNENLGRKKPSVNNNNGREFVVTGERDCNPTSASTTHISFILISPWVFAILDNFVCYFFKPTWCPRIFLKSVKNNRVSFRGTFGESTWISIGPCDSLAAIRRTSRRHVNTELMKLS